jgi:hypothetical protein
MELETRRKLAKRPYEKKIQMAGELVNLARALKKARKISLEEFWKSNRTDVRTRPRTKTKK